MKQNRLYWISRKAVWQYTEKPGMQVVEYQMLIAVVGVLLVTGLVCLWVSLANMSRLDTPAPVIVRKPEPEEEKEPLTRLGRPIREVQF